ncbi:MAG: histidine kinase dimerization/phosphoacceptor domain -containing protein [Candidatus Methanomethylophilaceae archaeon]
MPARRVENAMKDSEFLEAVIEGLCDPLAWLDVDGSLLFSNRPMREYLDSCDCEEQGCFLLACIHPEDRDSFQSWLQMPVSGGRRMHVRIRSKNSRWDHKICRSIPFQKDGRLVMFTAVPDNDPEIAEFLMVSDPVFKKVFQFLPDFVILVQNGKVVNVNNSTRILLGLDPQDDNGLIEDVFPDFDAIQVAIQRRETLMPDVAIQSPDGGSYHCELCLTYFEHPKGPTVLMVMHDRSEVLKVHEWYRSEQSRYRNLFENMQTGMAEQKVVRNQDGKVVDLEYVEVNPAFEVQTGLPRSVIGNGILKVMPNFEDFWFDMFVRVALGGRSEYAENYVADVDRWYSVFVFSTGPDRVAQIFLDISGQKRMEMELMDSLREREALLKEVHHRVHNNLQIIKGVIGMQHMLLEEGAARVSLQEAESRIQTIGQVHQSLYSSERLTYFRLAQHLQALVHETAKEFEKEVELEMVQRGEVQFVDMDQSIALSLALNELLTNSFKFAFGPNEKGRIHLEVLEEKDGFTIIYQDYGPGYPWDPQTTESPSLGMSLMRNLVQKQLKGTLSLSNRNGARAEINIRI